MRSHQVHVLKVNGLSGSPVSFMPSDIQVIRKALDQTLGLLGITASYFSGKSVLIHPNLVRPNPDTIPASFTDPRIIIALGETVKDLGAARILVGENPGFGFPSRKAFQEANLIEPLQKRGIEICFFDEEKWVEVDNPRATLYRTVKIAKSVMEADVFINVPKLKTHMLTEVSLSIKNLLGIIPDSQRMLYHRNDIIHKIVDLAMVRPPDLNIIDGIWAMEGQAPFHGRAVTDFNTIIAGTDMTAVDSVAAELMGFELWEIPHLMVARQQLWNNQLHQIQCTGDPVDQVKRRFHRPVLSSAAQFPSVTCIECGVCRGCLSAIRHSLDKLRYESDFVNIPAVTIISGRPMPNRATLDSWKGQLVLFGNCAAEFQFYEPGMRADASWIPGCPPHVLDLMNYLNQLRKGQ